MLALAAETVTVPEAVNVPEKVLLPVKVWVPARIASSDEVLDCFARQRAPSSGSR